MTYQKFSVYLNKDLYIAHFNTYGFKFLILQDK